MRKIALFIISLTFSGHVFAINMIYVKGGDIELAVRPYDGAPRTVPIYLNDFYLSSTELSVGAWKEYLDKSGYEYDWNYPPSRFEYGNLMYHMPQNDSQAIHLISFLEALEYCNWLSRSEGFDEVYEIDYVQGSAKWYRSGNGYRLPTEAEWQWAAIGGEYSQGNLYSGSDDLKDITSEISKRKMYSLPVATHQPNELGLYDMTGNIEEFCWDFFSFSSPDWSDGEKNPLSKRLEEYTDPVIKSQVITNYIGILESV